MCSKAINQCYSIALYYRLKLLASTVAVYKARDYRQTSRDLRLATHTPKVSSYFYCTVTVFTCVNFLPVFFHYLAVLYLFYREHGVSPKGLLHDREYTRHCMLVSSECLIVFFQI